MNAYMKLFVKKFALGIFFGILMFVAAILIVVAIGKNPFDLVKWYLTPIVCWFCLLYGTGWVFSINYIKKTWRKFLKIDGATPIRKGITESGWFFAVIYFIDCSIISLILSFFAGNILMLRDLYVSVKGKPPVSAKYKFDKEEDYEKWAEDLVNGKTKKAVKAE